MGREFDVIDLPDYELFGAFLRPALSYHGVHCDRIAISLHGRISTSISLNWGSVGEIPRGIEAIENLQYQAADLRYGLSHSYLDEWRAKYDLPSHYLCPWRFMRAPTPSRTPRCGEPPNLQFIGRTEKRKGPDLFVELAMWLPRSSYAKAYIIGPQDWSYGGVSSDRHLSAMMMKRGCKDIVTLLPSANRRDLDRLFGGRAITILPSRYDTFNLVAVESLLAGCPTAVGSGAGVCRFLEERLPGVPFVKIDMQRWQTSIPELAEILDDYDAYRDRLVDALQDSSFEPDGPTLEEIYGSQAASFSSARADLADWYARLAGHQSLLVSPTGETVGVQQIPDRQRTSRSRSLAARLSDLVRQGLRSATQHNVVQPEAAHGQAEAFRADYRRIHHLPEQTDAQIADKALQYGSLISKYRADRARLWRELARLESLRQNSLVAATYRLRDASGGRGPLS